MELSNNNATRTYTSGLFANWLVICVGLALPILLSPWVSRTVYPLVCLAEVFLLMIYIRSNATRHRPLCMRPVYLVVSVMIVVTVTTLSFNLMHVHWIFGTDHAESNRIYADALQHLSSITILLTAPVLALVGLWGWIAGHKSAFCLECRSRYRFASDDGFIGHLLRQESDYQIRTMVYIGLFLSVVEWVYYWVFFINVNINTPDRFMFTAVPLIILGLSVLYMAGRYTSINARANVLSREDDTTSDYVELRYIVRSGDDLLLEREEDALQNGKLIDTPAIVRLRNVHAVSQDEARTRFAHISGLEEFSLRYLYQGSACTGPARVYHYTASVESKETVDASQLKGKWYNALCVENLIQNNLTDPQLSGSIRRLYTMTMAWKTYDETGRRLYPIKNYRPTFRLKDFDEWMVNYDDPHWINIACNNQDQHLYHFRNFWRKYVRSIGC